MAQERTRPPRRPRFDKHASWVAIKPVRLSKDKFVELGGDIVGFRLHHLRYLWRRNAIAPKGSEYAAAMLGLLAERQDRRGAPDAPEIASAARDAGHTGGIGNQLEIEKAGGGWYRVMLGGEELAKLKGSEAVNEWLGENGYEPAL